MPEPYYTDEQVILFLGDCLDVMATLEAESVDAVCTDPPYGLEFMGKDWDRPWAVSATNAVGYAGRDELTLPAHRDNRNANCRACGGRQRGAKRCECPTPQWDRDPAADMRAYQLWCEQWAAECLRILKPGGHLLAFGGSRTWHRLAAAIEDAGFEIRDSIAWIYGSGFPKSLDVSKAIDKATGVQREDKFGGMIDRRIGPTGNGKCPKCDKWLVSSNPCRCPRPQDEPQTDAAKQWQGWGTALKPSHEPVVIARKPTDLADILDSIGSQLDRLESECSSSTAKPAGGNSPSRNPERAAAWSDSAHETAGAGTSPDESEKTDTCSSLETASMSLSTVMSWRRCLAVLYDLTSTFTTATNASLTTDLRTLSCSLSEITPSITTLDLTSQRTASCRVLAADNLFGAIVLNLRAIHARSVVENATGVTPTEPQGAVERSTAFEPVVVARKPLCGTVAANVLAYGTGALNIDGCRVATTDRWAASGVQSAPDTALAGSADGSLNVSVSSTHEAGRWPANVVLDDAAAAELDRQSGTLTSGANPTRRSSDKFPNAYGDFAGQPECVAHRGADSGGASRFFPTFRYTAKAATAERPTADGIAHPTVKPLDLMRWLVRLVTPPGGTVLEPFAGSGTTVEACIHEHKRCIAIEREPSYLPLIRARLSKPMQVGFDFEAGA